MVLSAGEGWGVKASPSPGDDGVDAEDVGVGGSPGENEASRGEKRSFRRGRVGNAPERGGEETVGESQVGPGETGDPLALARNSRAMTALAAATLRGLGRDELRRGGAGRDRALSNRRGAITGDVDDLRDSTSRRGLLTCPELLELVDPIEEEEDVEAGMTVGAGSSSKVLIGRYMLNTLVLLFVIPPAAPTTPTLTGSIASATRPPASASSSLIFFSTSANTASIEMPSNRIDGIRILDDDPLVYASSEGVK